jgi:hypothetical protein
MSKHWQVRSLIGWCSAIALVFPSAPVHAQLFNSPVDQLSVLERVALREGKVLVNGEQGKYVGKFLVSTTPEIVWRVLTDYNNFFRFLPHVVSSKVLETKGNQKVVEQIDQRSLLLFSFKSRIRSAIVETPKQRIEFRRIDGDLPKQMATGQWSRLRPIEVLFQPKS